MYLRDAGFIFSVLLSLNKTLSVLLQTVLARWQYADSLVPPGSINSFNGSSVLFILSILCSKNNILSSYYM